MARTTANKLMAMTDKEFAAFVARSGLRTISTADRAEFKRSEHARIADLQEAAIAEGEPNGYRRSTPTSRG